RSFGRRDEIDEVKKENNVDKYQNRYSGGQMLLQNFVCGCQMSLEEDEESFLT
ncbi:hypothetical protein CEXT_258751, partial [Caerostris extrusa]